MQASGCTLNVVECMPYHLSLITTLDLSYGHSTQCGCGTSRSSIIESDGPERAPTTGTSQYGALLPGTVLSG